MAGGRKLEFNKIQALEAAMQVFWKKGFLGASLADLTQGMGINKPSMYATFGNKEALFVQATEHYLDTYAKPTIENLHQPNMSLHERLKAYLMAVVNMQCGVGRKSNPKGCYISLCVAEAAGDSLPQDALDTISEAGGYVEIMLTEFFKTDEEAVRLRYDGDAHEKALFLVTLINGTAAMARAGTTADALESVIDRAIIAITAN
ncbi:MAG: TetR/AcrR family transcriptional regulator [Pseudomonadales bacterium]|nr:TetR/AcrR family transcriptional regulator [Pseudomonadales bacterium]